MFQCSASCFKMPTNNIAIMKKITILALSLSMIAAIPSCKDDDEPTVAPTSTVTIDKDILSAGISAEMKSSVIEVPIDCDGEWTATFAKGTEWADILDWEVTYNGKQTLLITVDENNTGAARTAILYVANSDGEVQEITLHQKATGDDNGSGEAFAKSGLGTGIDYDYVLNTKGIAARSAASVEPLKFEPTKVHKNNNIFNFKTIEKLQNKMDDPLSANAYVEAEYKLADLEAKFFDKSIAQDKLLDVSLTMGLEFGPIEFRANGQYTAKKKESRAKLDYTIVRYAPMYNVYIGTSDLIDYAIDPMHNDFDPAKFAESSKKINIVIDRYKLINSQKNVKNLNENGLTAAQQTVIDNMWYKYGGMNDLCGLFSNGFCRRYNELYQAIMTTEDGLVDDKAAQTALRAIDNEYGPFFISGGDYGGSLTMTCRLDTTLLKGSDSLVGTIAANVMECFNLEGSVTYMASGLETLRESEAKFYIYGGNANETANGFLAALTGGNATALDKWQSILNGWVNSMWSSDKSPEKSQAAPISYTISPIWMLFADPEVQKYAQDYFIATYRERNIEAYLGIMKGEYKFGADALLDFESEAYKN